MEQKDNRKEDVLDPEMVLEYLKKHPDFLLQHEQILDVMLAPSRWNEDNVVDFQHAVIERHKGQIEKLRASSDDLLDVVRANVSSIQKVHNSVLALIEAESFGIMNEVITSVFPVLLDVDVALLCFEPVSSQVSQFPSFVELPQFLNIPQPSDLLSSNVQIVNTGVVDRIMGERKDFLLKKSSGLEQDLFGAFSGLVKSEAYARLKVRNVSVPGMLVLGSRDKNAFKSDFTGTSGLTRDLLRFLVRAVELNIRRWLKADEDNG